jgi:thiosulfate dehydrogenase
MLRGFILGVILSALAAAVAAYMIVVNGLIPAAADQPAGALERWVAENDLRAVLNANAPKTANPIPVTDANLIAGIRLYADNCSVCHGTAAGEAAASPVAKGEAPPPPQLATDGVEDDPDGVTFWKIKHGIRFTGMPSWARTLNDQQIWTLALFLKHMNNLPAAPEAAWRSVAPLGSQPTTQPPILAVPSPAPTLAVPPPAR